jgi:predicted chitinase
MQLNLLKKITGPVKIADLDRDTMKELQKALTILGHPLGIIDGWMGTKTGTAWEEFKTENGQGSPELIGPSTVSLLAEKLSKIVEKQAYDFSTKQGTIEAIKAECHAQGIGLPAQIAYVLATVQHETDQTYRPVVEAYYLGPAKQKTYLSKLRYRPYYGRGYVQLTWKDNYKFYGNLLHLDLVGSPELALEPKTALFVLVHGFKTGAFTGRKISDYINEHHVDFLNARRCINGLDRAADIAALAKAHLDRLT